LSSNEDRHVGNVGYVRCRASQCAAFPIVKDSRGEFVAGPIEVVVFDRLYEIIERAWSQGYGDFSSRAGPSIASPATRTNYEKWPP
jgi:hypothetical protein